MQWFELYYNTIVRVSILNHKTPYSENQSVSCKQCFEVHYNTILSADLHDEEGQYASTGVTMEIISLKEDEAFGMRQIKLKAEGRQRFKIISRKSQLDG